MSVADTQTVFEEVEARHILCNAVDGVPHCNCYASAVVRRDALQIAISTAGKSPALAQRLRKELENGTAPYMRFGYSSWVNFASRLSQDKAMDGETRRRILHEQASTPALESFCGSIKQETHCQS